MTDPAFLSEVRFDDNGLVPAIAQDAETGKVLMMAWMNAESLRLTVEEGRAVYWSRSRQQLWRKGESSGNTQLLKELRIDCDGDTILMRVEQIGGIACHTGRESCLFRRLESDRWEITDPVLQEPSTIYGDNQSK